MENLPKHDEYVAHAPLDLERPWHSLSEHLEGVANRAAGFLGSAVDPTWGRFAGLWHDLGKFAPDWQEFIRAAGEEAHNAHVEEDRVEARRRRGPDHSTAGAIHAVKTLGEQLGIPLAFAIAGHHAGLPNRERLRSDRLKNQEKCLRYEMCRGAIEAMPVGQGGPPRLPEWLESGPRGKDWAHSLEFFTRMLFSALTDADFIDTEVYFARAGADEAAAKNAARLRGWPQLASYQPTLDAFLAAKQSRAPSTTVNQLRAEVLDACRASGANSRGAFSLTVPTGGGKTLSGLAFALGHAYTHNLSRVIIALPFTSIIEQTSGVLRDVFAGLGPDVVLEHHSAVDSERVTALGRVAAENWDAPLVVTTQVQLFESLFANRSGACRKLHSLIDSVLVLDEVQSLPSNLLEPILDVIDELVRHYGVTVLLMTATQPALHRRPIGAREFPGLTTVPREIIPEGLASRLWDGLRRVEVHWPTTWNADASEEPDSFWSELASHLAETPQALAIAHLKKDAQALWQALSRLDPTAFHLSAAMCPAHRSKVLAEVKRCLKAGNGCRLVSTQVVEAGVDIDFPVVFRAMAGLESLAQSAGRCNREGTRPKGDFFIYKAPTSPPKSLRLHKEVAQTMLDAAPDLDIFEPSTFRNYFSRLYAHKELDLPGVQPMRAALNFQETAAAFKMIEQASTTVFVPFDDRATSALKALRFAGPSRDRLRLLQRYGVSVYANQFKSLQAEGAIEELHPGLWSLCSDLNYDKNLGLRTSADASVALIF